LAWTHLIISEFLSLVKREQVTSAIIRIGILGRRKEGDYTIDPIGLPRETRKTNSVIVVQAPEAAVLKNVIIM
jgi:hypothetical protein